MALELVCVCTYKRMSDAVFVLAATHQCGLVKGGCALVLIMSPAEDP